MRMDTGQLFKEIGLSDLSLSAVVGCKRYDRRCYMYEAQRQRVLLPALRQVAINVSWVLCRFNKKSCEEIITDLSASHFRGVRHKVTTKKRFDTYECCRYIDRHCREGLHRELVRVHNALWLWIITKENTPCIAAEGVNA
jgi:hypothetical protein